MDSDLQEELQAIRAKLENLMAAVDELRMAKRARAEKDKARKVKLPPMTEDEIKAHQVKFKELFDHWTNGHEMEAQAELEKLDPEHLRRFADANNLNVTSKMSAQKLLQLIGARFREKRQLLGGLRSKQGGE